MKLDYHLDFVPLAADLRRNDSHMRLVIAVGRAAALGTIRDDLREAAASLRIIREMHEDSDGRPNILAVTNDNVTIAGGLFTNAIILYARATFTSGDRPALLGEDGLTADDKATHDEVKKLRNTTFAHFGNGENAADGPFVRAAVVRSFSREQYRYGVYTTRAQHKVGIGARMETLIATRLKQIAAKQQRLLDEVETRFDEAASTDDKLRCTLHQYAFDVGRICASSVAAAHMRAMLDSGDVEDFGFTDAVPEPKTDN